MIGPKMYLFICDDCKASQYFIYLTARKHGWAIAKDRLHCYCPKCAPKHRNVGRKKQK